MEERLKHAAWLAVIVATLASAACGARREPVPTPEAPQATFAFDLAGQRVMVLPAQGSPAPGETEPVPGFDAELSFWLAERGPRVNWLFPPQLERSLERNPSMQIRPRALAVEIFTRAEVKNIGDPLYGDLRLLGALSDARYALVPVSARFGATPTGERRAEIAAALIDTIGGRVLWFGVVAGEPGADDATRTASAAQALARAVLR